MTAPIKLGIFAVALAVALAVSWGIGGAVGPVDRSAENESAAAGHELTEESAKPDSGSKHDAPEPRAEGAGHGGHSAESNSRPSGLTVSEHGYALDLASSILPAGRTTVEFRILGPDGRAVTRYQPTHDKELHFIAVRRDSTGFQHVHPRMDPSGRWQTELELTPGVWRFFADFQPGEHGEPMTLGVDASVAGDYRPQPLPEPSRTDEVDDYTVTLDGQLTPGETSKLILTVTRDGKPVTDLQPYLAAYGHLVALRSGDLAYLHVHPDGKPGDGSTRPGPKIIFYATAPSAGDYRLYLDFKHGDAVRTAEFTVRTTGSPTSGAESTPANRHGGASSGHGGNGHN